MVRERTNSLGGCSQSAEASRTILEADIRWFWVSVGERPNRVEGKGHSMMVETVS